jgi:CMP-N-acetylneuraminic acid synthetase
MVRNSIVIIPARGGSSRIPKKNIIDFLGKPMIAYTIEACKSSNIFSRVVVSTDSEEIAEISKKLGADVPFLRTEAADPITPVSEAILFALEQAEKYYCEHFEYIAMAMANCPIRNADVIKKAYSNFVEKNYDSQISCFKFGYMNPWWALKLSENGVGTRIMDIPVNARSQDLEPLYCPTGAIWIAKQEHLRKHKSFYGEHRYFEIDWKSAIDIDNYEDLELAKAVFAMQK